MNVNQTHNPHQLKCLRVEITGRVQGVGFRYWTLDMANQLAITGWVRNRHNGSVEAVFCGASLNVEEILTLCKQGPRFANVKTVNVIETVDQHFDHFVTRSTG